MVAPLSSYTHFNSLLEDENVTIDDLLSHPVVLDECRCENKKLLSFLTKPACMKQLTETIIASPEVSSPLDMQYKKGFVSCEILTSGISCISGTLLCNLDCLDVLYEKLDAESGVSPLTLVFIHKVFVALIRYSKYEMLQYFISKPDLVDNIVSNIDRPAISDLVFQLLQIEDINGSCTDLAQVFNDAKIVEQLLKLFNSQESNETHSAVMHFLTVLVSICRCRNHCQHKAVLLESLESAQTVNLILSQIFDEENDHVSRDSLLIPGIFYLVYLVDLSTNTQSDSPLPSLPDTVECCIWSTPVARTISTAVCVYLPRIKDLLLLKDSVEFENNIQTASFISLKNKSVTTARIYLVRFLRYLWECRSEHLLNDLLRLNVLGDIYNMFSHFTQNSFLHSTFYSIVQWLVQQALLNTDISDTDTDQTRSLIDLNNLMNHSFSSNPAVLNFDECQTLLQNSDLLPETKLTKESVHLKVTEEETAPLNIYWRFLYQLIIDNMILDRIRTNWIPISPTKPTHYRPGNLGHTRLIANLLNYVIGPLPKESHNPTNDQIDILLSAEQLSQIAESGFNAAKEFYNADLQIYLRSGLCDEAWQNWCEFVQNELANANKISYIDYNEFKSILSHSPVFDLPSADEEMRIAYNKFAEYSVGQIQYKEQIGLCTNYISIGRAYIHRALDYHLDEVNFSLNISEDWENSVCFEQVCNELIQLNSEELGKDVIRIEEKNNIPTSSSNPTTVDTTCNTTNTEQEIMSNNDLDLNPVQTTLTSFPSNPSIKTTNSTAVCTENLSTDPKLLYKLFSEIKVDRSSPNALENISLESLLKNEFNISLTNKDEPMMVNDKTITEPIDNVLVTKTINYTNDTITCKGSDNRSHEQQQQRKLMKLVNEQDYWIDVSGKINTVDLSNNKFYPQNNNYDYFTDQIKSKKWILQKSDLSLGSNALYSNGLHIEDEQPYQTVNLSTSIPITIEHTSIDNNNNNNKSNSGKQTGTKRLIMPTKRSSLQKTPSNIISHCYNVKSQLSIQNNNNNNLVNDDNLSNSSPCNNSNDLQFAIRTATTKSSNVFFNTIENDNPSVSNITETTTTTSSSSDSNSSSNGTTDGTSFINTVTPTKCLSTIQSNNNSGDSNMSNLSVIPTTESCSALENDASDMATKPKFRTHRTLQLRPGSECQMDEF